MTRGPAGLRLTEAQSEYIINHLRTRGLSQAQLSRNMGIHYWNLTAKLSRKSSLKPKEAASIYEHLGASEELQYLNEYAQTSRQLENGATPPGIKALGRPRGPRITQEQQELLIDGIAKTAYTPTEMSKLLQISYGTFSKKLHGKTTLQPAEARRIYEALGAPAELAFLASYGSSNGSATLPAAHTERSPDETVQWSELLEPRIARLREAYATAHNSQSRGTLLDGLDLILEYASEESRKK